MLREVGVSLFAHSRHATSCIRINPNLHFQNFSFLTGINISVVIYYLSFMKLVSIKQNTTNAFHLSFFEVAQNDRCHAKGIFIKRHPFADAHDQHQAPLFYSAH